MDKADVDAHSAAVNVLQQFATQVLFPSFFLFFLLAATPYCSWTISRINPAFIACGGRICQLYASMHVLCGMLHYLLGSVSVCCVAVLCVAVLCVAVLCGMLHFVPMLIGC